MQSTLDEAQQQSYNAQRTASGSQLTSHPNLMQASAGPKINNYFQNTSQSTSSQYTPSAYLPTSHEKDSQQNNSFIVNVNLNLTGGTAS
jgi:hypothetical protein